jgi:hypothetical protein
LNCFSRVDVASYIIWEKGTAQLAAFFGAAIIGAQTTEDFISPISPIDDALKCYGWKRGVLNREKSSTQGRSKVT